MKFQNYDFAVHLYYGIQNGGYLIDNLNHRWPDSANKYEAEYRQNLKRVYHKKLEEIAKDPDSALIIGRIEDRENEHSLVEEFIEYSFALLGGDRVAQVIIPNLYVPSLPHECREDVEGLKKYLTERGVDLDKANFMVYGEISDQCVMQVAVNLVYLKGHTIPPDYIIPASFGREYREWSMDSHELIGQKAKSKGVWINQALCGDQVDYVIKTHPDIFPHLNKYFHLHNPERIS